MSSKACFFRY